MNPRDQGFSMPAEWVGHSACWMAWPCRMSMWTDFAGVSREFAEVANTIARFEPVRVLVPPALRSSAEALLGADVTLIEMPIDDSWLRDSGPNFLRNEQGELAGTCFRFNAWGEKHHPFDSDAALGRRMLEQLGLPVFASELTAEGGAITVDGEGTVITTETCLLNRNRNPGWSKQKVSDELCRSLGAEKVIWLPGDETDLETDGHVDGIAVFLEPGRVLVEMNPDPNDPYASINQANFDALRGCTDARGREIQIETINEGNYSDPNWDGECYSYVNAFLANGAVIVPGYGQERDAEAVECWQALYPEREVVQVQIPIISTGGGGVHCITQQQPIRCG